MNRKLFALLTASILVLLSTAEFAQNKIESAVHPEDYITSAIILHIPAHSIIVGNDFSGFPGTENPPVPSTVRLPGNNKTTLNFQIFPIALRRPFIYSRRPIYIMVKCLRH